jgi:hypothetical protein
MTGWRAVPAHQDRACWRVVSEAIVRHAHLARGLPERHSSAVKKRVESGRGIVGSRAPAGILGQPSEKEDRDVLRGYDVVAEARSPQLNE